MERLRGNWANTGAGNAINYVCGHCGKDIESREFYFSGPGQDGQIYICHRCNRPTFFDKSKSPATQMPAPIVGRPIGKLPADVSDLYNEIRAANASGSFSLVILGARKLLMHLAVSHGAEPSKTFLEYVDYLHSEHHVPPKSKGWVDKIRKMGNDANHEIVIGSQKDAETIIGFLGLLLVFMYEYADDETNDEN